MTELMFKSRRAKLPVLILTAAMQIDAASADEAAAKARRHTQGVHRARKAAKALTQENLRRGPRA
jgi:hypothetical protein